MLEECSTKNFQGLFNAVTQFVTNSQALFNGIEVIILKEAIRRFLARFWESRSMAEAVEQCELIKAIAFENAFKIEFKVCRSRGSGGVSKQPQGNAIGQNSPRCLLGV